MGSMYILFYVLHFFFYHLVPPSSSFFFLILLLLLLFFFVVFIFCCCFVFCCSLLLMKGKTPGMRENRLPPAGEDVCAALHPTWSRGYQTCNPTLIRSSYYKTDEQGSNVKNIPGQSSATRHVEKLNDAKVVLNLKFPREVPREDFEAWLQMHNINACRIFGTKITFHIMKQAAGVIYSLFGIALYSVFRDDAQALMVSGASGG